MSESVDGADTLARSIATIELAPGDKLKGDSADEDKGESDGSDEGERRPIDGAQEAGGSTTKKKKKRKPKKKVSQPGVLTMRQLCTEY